MHTVGIKSDRVWKNVFAMAALKAMALLALAVSSGALIQDASAGDWYQQKLTVLAQDEYRTDSRTSPKQSCEFAAEVIRRFSRPETGLFFKSTCGYSAGLGEFFVNTEIFIDRRKGKATKAFRKLNAKMRYKSATSAKYAARLLQKLNLKESHVLLDATQSGSLVALETVAMVSGSSRAARAKRSKS